MENFRFNTGRKEYFAPNASIIEMQLDVVLGSGIEDAADVFDDGWSPTNQGTGV